MIRETTKSTLTKLAKLMHLSRKNYTLQQANHKKSSILPDLNDRVMSSVWSTLIFIFHLNMKSNGTSFGGSTYKYYHLIES